MLVKPQSNGHRMTGIYIGAGNVRRYFPRRISAIDLEIDHLRIRCTLTPEFWLDAPEICDPRLSDWLELKHLQSAGKRNGIALDMIPSGADSFVLGPAVPAEPRRVHAAAGPVHAPVHTDVHEISKRIVYPLSSPATAA